MAAGDIFTLKTSIAPRLVRILYGIALVLIALAVIAGVTRGVLRIRHPLPARSAMVDMVTPNADVPPQPDAAAQPGQRGMGMRRMGPGRWGMRGPGRGMGHRMGLMGRQPPAVMGAFQIVRALVMGVVALLVVRILAELAGAILATGAKARQP